MFEDFESGLVRAYSYNGTGSTATYTYLNTGGVDNPANLQMNFSIIASSWGGAGFGSSYADAYDVLNASGTITLQVKLKTTAVGNFTITIQEGDVYGADSEN